MRPTWEATFPSTLAPATLPDTRFRQQLFLPPSSPLPEQTVGLGLQLPTP